MEQADAASRSERTGTGFLVTAPAMLIMKYVGQEGSLGLIQSISGGLTAILIYLLGRFTKPKDRITVFAVGITIFWSEQ